MSVGYDLALDSAPAAPSAVSDAVPFGVQNAAPAAPAQQVEPAQQPSVAQHQGALNPQTYGFPPAASQPQAPQQPAGQPQQPNVQDQIKAFAESYGLPAEHFAGFTDLSNAQAAARLLLDSFAREGLGGWEQSPVLDGPAAPVFPPAPNVVQQPQPAQVTEALKLDLDEATLDPKLVAAFKQLQEFASKGVQSATERAEKAEKLVQEFQTRQQNEQRQAVATRASSAVDKLASPRYGVGRNRTAAQKLAVENLYRLADGIIYGMHNRGLPVPQIEQVIQQAVLLDQTASAPAQPVQPQQQQPQLLPQQYQGHFGQAFAPPRAPVNTPFPQQNRPISLENDQQFAQAALEILRRPS